MQTLEHFIETQGSRILERWAEAVRHAASARGLTRPELMNILPIYLASLAEPARPRSASRQELVESHVSSRIRHGFDLPELQSEFTLLGRCIFQVWSEMPPEERPDAAALDGILDIVNASTVLLSDMFVRHLLEDAQSEKRYFRLIRQAFHQPGAGGARPTLADQLNAAVAVVMEALGAATAAILLYEHATDKLVMTASAGLADESFTRYARSVTPSSFVGMIASREEITTTIPDAATTELDVTGTLRHSGIHSLLGVRIPLRSKLIGVMYIGLREHRTFSAQERRRIEALAEHFALLIENAQLTLSLEEQIEALRAEEKVRDVFVSILAHDLRGPIAAARVAAQMLERTKDEAKALHRTALIIRNLDRADNLVSDMLDAQRIRDGQGLPISREPCDLDRIVRDVVDELSAQHGDRFVVVAPQGAITGRWGQNELRRALWNLASNALKYGSKHEKVRITLRVLPGSVEVEVHNEGPPIPPDQQANLFEPFKRASSTSTMAGGWGLGLAVVRGVAEAHGGKVDVESAPDHGTTFTIRLPLDGVDPDA